MPQAFGLHWIYLVHGRLVITQLCSLSILDKTLRVGTGSLGTISHNSILFLSVVCQRSFLNMLSLHKTGKLFDQPPRANLLSYGKCAYIYMTNMTFVDGGDLLRVQLQCEYYDHETLRGNIPLVQFFPLKFYNKNITNWGA